VNMTFQYATAARILLLASCCLASCRSQVLPGPMDSLYDPMPAGESSFYPEGPEEVIVIRHADPCRVRPAGISSSYPLSFYNKSTRLHSGSSIYSASGGRIEVLWPNSTSIVLSGEGSGVIGATSRGEPTFIIRAVERAVITLREGEEVELLGGSVLTASSGPLVLEHGAREVLRVRNQSKESAQIAFRSETVLLEPGEVVDLPLLSAGAAPSVEVVEMESLKGVGFRAQLRGACEVEERDGTLSIHSQESSELHALGVRIHLEAGESVTLDGLLSVQPQAGDPMPAAATTQP